MDSRDIREISSGYLDLPECQLLIIPHRSTYVPHLNLTIPFTPECIAPDVLLHLRMTPNGPLPPKFKHCRIYLLCMRYLIDDNDILMSVKYMPREEIS